MYERYWLDPCESELRGPIIPNIVENATPIFDRGKIWNFYILMNILMIIHVFYAFWPEKSIPEVNYTLKCFFDKFTATPIYDRGKHFVKHLNFSILQYTVMIMHVFNVFASEKSIPVAHFTLKCFSNTLMATPIASVTVEKFCQELKFLYFHE